MVEKTPAEHTDGESFEENQEQVLYSIMADVYAPGEGGMFRGLNIKREDTPERVWSVHRPIGEGEFEYVTTLNVEAFRDTTELRAYLDRHR